MGASKVASVPGVGPKIAVIDRAYSQGRKAGHEVGTSRDKMEPTKTNWIPGA